MSTARTMRTTEISTQLAMRSASRSRHRGRTLVRTALGTLIVAGLFASGCSAHRHGTHQAGRQLPATAPGFSPSGVTQWGFHTGTGADGAFTSPGGHASLAGEELWIIASPDEAGATEGFGLVDLLCGFAADSFAGAFTLEDDRLRGVSIGDALSTIDPCGGIIGIPMDYPEPALVHVPLEHTEVRANIAGFVAGVEVMQRFHNPYSGKIEAVYVFPLPQDAGVSEFVMTIGERRIRGIIRDRAEAEQIYHEARSRGHVASLMTQQRPNIFTQKVANIEPGRRIEVQITYYNTLAYDDGWYSFAFPMVVGPRFNPSHENDPIIPVARGSGVRDPLNSMFDDRGRPIERPQPTQVPYLRPDERSGHDIALTVSLEAGVEIEEIECRTHAVDTRMRGETGALVQLSQYDNIPNKDFVLRWRVAGEQIKANLIVSYDPSRHDGWGHFALMVYPPRETTAHALRNPIELIFVIDCSGSMSGVPLDQAKRAVERALRSMDSRDAFSVIRFSQSASALGPAAIPATPQNVQRGIDFVRSLRAGGGTYMMEGIRAACDLPRDAERDRYIVFMTDGYIGNEAEVLGFLSERLGRSRVFSFGIGSSPNTYLLERMAWIGRGAVAVIGLNDPIDSIMDQFTARISYPALEDLRLEFGGGMHVAEMYPGRLPDLFAGRPVTVTGRFRGEGATTVRVLGRAGGEEIVIPLSVDLDRAPAHDGLARIWARSKIMNLEHLALVAHSIQYEGSIPHEIRRVALEYGLLSAYTAFVAVDSSRRTEGDHGTTVHVPVPVPEGVRYDTTVER